MNFYKYIVKKGKSYEIMKDNEKFGTYSNLTDALYERDRLVASDWNWDDMLQMEETENMYEKMKLPPFIHEYSYIYERIGSYLVFKDNDFRGKFNTKKDAEKFANQIGGEVEPANIRYLIKKSINGFVEEFGRYGTLEEAKKVRDELIANGWKT